MPDSTAASDFEPHRRHLIGLAYRMLGSVAEAEDVAQEAYLRWHSADRSAVEDARAYLSRVAIRLCLDHRKSARVRRESYVGPWLPEPIVDDEPFAAESAGEYARDLSATLMLALERLSPLERAAFLLHDVFDFGFAEVARTLGRSEAACRQLAARARDHVRQARPRFPVAAEEGDRIAGAFLEAARTGDVEGLARLLAEDAMLHTDGGGKRPAALRPIAGPDRISRFYAGLAKKARSLGPIGFAPARIGGQPGFVITEPDGFAYTMAFDVRDGLIAAIYVVRNPDKLGHLGTRA